MIKFQCQHATPLDQAQATLVFAVAQLSGDQHHAEAASLAAELDTATCRRGRGPRRLGELLPAVLAKLGVNPVESSSSGKRTQASRSGLGAEQRRMSPRRKAVEKRGVLSDHNA